MAAQKAENAYTKWIVGIVGSGLVSLLGFYGVRDRIAIDASLIRLQTIVESQSAILSKHEVELQLLKNDLKKLEEVGKSNNEKLDLVLIEVKKNRRN
jgi:hypothetical protein